MHYQTFAADQARQLFAARKAVLPRPCPAISASASEFSAARPFIQDGNDLYQIRYQGDDEHVLRVGFAPNSDRQITQHEFNASASMRDIPERWNAVFTKWAHGGWYARAVRYPAGSVGCVSNNYDDGKWRIVCDDRRTGGLGDAGDFTYPSRLAAARAEYELAQAATQAFMARIRALYEVDYPSIGTPRVSREDVLEAVRTAGEASTCEWLISEGHAACPGSARSMIASAATS